MSADRVLRKSERCKLRAAGTSKVSEPEAKNARVTIGGTKFMEDGKAGSKIGFQMPASRAKDTFSTSSNSGAFCTGVFPSVVLGLLLEV
jgi:hypothetical protein